MSHEIRTPLTSISGFVDLLTRTGKLTRQQRRYIELVRVANVALLAIVNDILDFSKVEAGQVEIECRAFSLLALIHNTLAIARVAAAAKNLVLNYSIDRGVPEWLIGDHARLRQVLLNLLSNAVKFTEAVRSSSTCASSRRTTAAIDSFLRHRHRHRHPRRATVSPVQEVFADRQLRQSAARRNRPGLAIANGWSN